MPLYLQSCCRVRNQSIRLNGTPVFSDPGAPSTAAFLLAAYRHFRMNHPRFFKMDLLCRLALIAVEALIRLPGVRLPEDPEKTGLVFSNRSASMETDLHYLSTICDKSRYFPSPSVFVYTLPNTLMGELCMRHRITGECVFFVEPAFAPDLLVRYLEELFREQRLDAALGGWVELDAAAHHDAFVFLTGRKGLQELHPEVLGNLHLRDWD
jgi:hypothetical protein